MKTTATIQQQQTPLQRTQLETKRLSACPHSCPLSDFVCKKHMLSTDLSEAIEIELPLKA
jgi:hypothetical protein